jgi:hypothetical protein
VWHNELFIVPATCALCSEEMQAGGAKTAVRRTFCLKSVDLVLLAKVILDELAKK